MNHGFEAFNDFGHVLVSNEFHSLHWFGDAELIKHEQVKSTHGGYRHLTYRIESLVPFIPFITIPTEDYYGIAGIRRMNDGKNGWVVDVIASGTSNGEPRMLCFADVNAFWPPPERYGLVVTDANGQTAFDSRARPLVVTNAGDVRPREEIYTRSVSLDPKHCGSCSSGCGSAMRPNQHNTYNWLFQEEEPAFFFPALGTGFRMEGADKKKEKTDWYGKVTIKLWVSVYWAFYRTGIRRRNDNLECGWVTVDSGCASDYKKKTSWGFGGIFTIIGIVAGGFGGILTGIALDYLISGALKDSASVEGGSGPDSSYTTSTKTVSVMVTDASIYRR